MLRIIYILIPTLLSPLLVSCGRSGMLSLAGPWKIAYEDREEFRNKNFDDSSWETVYLPVQTGRNITTVWLRKNFTVPEHLTGESLAIFVGKIIDTDIVYINGMEIGRSGSEPPVYIPMWNYNRYYYIPPGILNPAGENTIAVRSYAAYDPKFADIPAIGSVNNIHSLTAYQNIMARHLPMTMGLMILFIGLFTLILFVLNPVNKTQLLFAAASLLWGVLSVHYFHHDYSAYYNLQEKIYFSLLAVEIALIYFLLQAVLAIRVRILELIVALFTIATAALCFSYPLHEHMYGRGYLLIGILGIAEQVIWGVLIIAALYRKQKNAYIAGIGYLLFMSGVIHDALAISGLYIIEVYFISFSYPALLISFAIIFIRDFSAMEQRLELMDELARKNRIISRQKKELEIRNFEFENDLKLARAIQENFIPREMPGGNIRALYKPMKDVGGDFFDFIHFDNPDLLGIFISDVSGHGVPAALITAMLKVYLEQAGALLLEPDKLMRYLNEKLLPLIGNNFITVFYAVFNKKSNEFRYINAGHTNPIILDGNVISFLPGTRSVPIAAFSGERLLGWGKSFRDNTVILGKGSRVILYTDGLTEARSAANPGRDFESSELFQVILKINRDDPAGFLEEIYRELIKFKGNDIFEDDVCIICMDV
jgi:serine phosphatase RsbU (regulator of sigma subunit)